MTARGSGPRRVALVVGTTAGGTGTHVSMLAGALARQGIRADVLGPPAANDGFRFGGAGGSGFIPVEFGDRPRIGDVRAVLRLRRLLAWQPDADGRPGGGPDGGPDVAHAHGMRAGALAAIALAGRRRPPLVVTVHNAPPAGALATVIYRALERVVARRADLVLCVSADLEERMRAAGARRVARAVVPAPAGPRAAAGAHAPVPDGGPPAGPDGRPVVLAVGRLTAQKGFGTLLRAAADWRDIDPRPRVLIVGAGPSGGDLRRQAAELGVDAHFPGWRDDVPALLAAASVFVLPSSWEGQPLILQEALRAGVPVVASRAGGIPDLVGEGAAVLVPPGQPGPLAGAVRQVLADPALAARLRAAARARARELPSGQDAGAAALQAYATVLRNSPVSR